VKRLGVARGRDLRVGIAAAEQFDAGPTGLQQLLALRRVQFKSADDFHESERRLPLWRATILAAAVRTPVRARSPGWPRRPSGRCPGCAKRSAIIRNDRVTGPSARWRQPGSSGAK